MKRLLPLVAALLLVVAATGLSSLRTNDYCDTAVPPGGAEPDAIYPGTDYVLAPPGLRCVYRYDDGHTVTRDYGDWAAFLVMLAGGAVALARRTRYAWASLIVLAAGGAAVLYAPEFNALIAGVMYGLPLALLATRSWFATIVAGAVLFFGAVAYLWDGSTLGWAVLLALVSLGEKVLDPLEKRLVRVLVGPRPELE